METEKPNLIRKIFCLSFLIFLGNQVPQLPVSMKLSGIEYSFDAKNGVWVQRGN